MDKTLLLRRGLFEEVTPQLVAKLYEVISRKIIHEVIQCSSFVL